MEPMSMDVSSQACIQKLPTTARGAACHVRPVRKDTESVNRVDITETQSVKDVRRRRLYRRADKNVVHVQNVNQATTLLLYAKEHVTGSVNHALMDIIPEPGTL